MTDPRGRVLIVDDEESIRTGVSRKLESQGYDCVTACDGAQALETVADTGFDLVLLDVKMPGLSGIDILPEIMTSQPDVCVVMASAMADTQTAVEAMKLGAYDYVTKPFSLEALTIRVEKALERKRLVEENKDFRLKLAEKALEESEGQYAALLDSIADAVIRLRESTITWCNDRTCDMFGYARDELIGQDAVFMSAGNISAGDYADTVRVSTRGTDCFRGASLTLKKDGTPMHVEFSVSRIPGKDPVEFVAVVRDVTERKKAEEQIAIFHRFAEASVHGKAITTLDGVIDYLNPSMCRILGVQTPGDVIGRRLDEYYCDEVRDRMRTEALRAMEGEGQWSGEIELVSGDGAVIPVLANIFILTAPEGEPDCLAIVFADITDRKQSEDALRQSEEILRLMFQGAGDGVAFVGLDGRVLQANRALARIHAYEAADELLGLDSMKLLAEREHERAGRMLASPADAAFEAREFALLRADGSEFTGEVTAAVVRDAVGEPSGFMVITRDVSERKRLEDELRRQEEYFRALIENSSDAVEILDAEGVVRYKSPSYRHVLGHNPDEQAGTDFSKNIHPDDVERCATAFRELLATPGSSQVFEVRARHADGTWRTIEAVGTNMLSDPIVKGIIVNVRDVTERRQSEESFRTIFENASYGILLADVESARFFMGNRTICRMLGRDREELEHMSVPDIHPLESLPEVMDAFERQARGELLVATDLPVLRADGSAFYADITSAPIEVMGKSYVMGIFSDVTDRKQAQEALQQAHDELEKRVKQRTRALEKANRKLKSEMHERKEAERRVRQQEEYFRSLIENSSDAIAIMDADGTILYESPSVERILGYRPDELVGRNVVEYVHGDASQEVASVRATILGTPGQPVGPVEMSIRHRDRSWRTVECMLHNLLDEPKVGGVIVNYRDVTERREAEDDLRETLTELQRSNDELEQFAYVASHDLQEPLRMVSNYVELLEMDYKGKLSEDADEYIDFITDGTRRMFKLIDDLLAFSRVRTKAQPFEPTDVNHVLEDVLENLRTSIEEAQAEVTSGDMPTVTADACQVAQVFQNLISNAIKFRGERPPRIEISAQREKGRRGKDGAESSKDHWVFSVRDNGIGLDPEYAEKIFVIFQRLHSQEEYPGTGIGLAVCKKIVERHGGRIWVESDPGEGSVFHFTIPDREEEEQ